MNNAATPSAAILDRRALINAHGGALTAASDGPGTGARFTITLPGSADSG